MCVCLRFKSRVFALLLYLFVVWRIFCCYYLFSAIFFTLLPDFFFVIFWFGLWPKQIFSLCGFLVHQLNEQRTAHKAESATNRSVIFDLSNRQQQEYKTKKKKTTKKSYKKIIKNATKTLAKFRRQHFFLVFGLFACLVWLSLLTIW